MATTAEGDVVRPALSVNRISKHFPGVKALSGIDLNIREGRIHALLGENGAGKSTLMKILAGDQSPDSGSIFLNGERVTISSPRVADRLGVTLVHQELAMIPQLSLAENIVLGRERSKAGVIDTRATRATAEKIMQRLGYEGTVLVPAADVGVATQQLAEIARALHRNQRVLMLDEPTSSLTQPEVERLHAIILRLKREGRAIVYISHRLQEVIDLECEDVTVLRDGEITGQFTWSSGYTEQDLVFSMVGRSVEIVPLPQRELGPVVLEVREIRRGVNSPPVSFSVRAGEIVGLAGMIGSGRTELMRAVVGADPAVSGEVEVNGKSIGRPSVRSGIRAGFALLSEDRKAQGLALHMSIAQNVTLPDPPRRADVLLRRERNRITNLASTTVGLNRDPAVLVGGLSGGNQQKAVLARWVLGESSVFVFDEPTRGVDIGAKQEIYAQIERLAKGGAAIVVISSELVEVLRLADRTLVMRHDSIVSEYKRGEASENLIFRDAARS